jgi:exosortase A-associated hydrolase 2
LFAVQSAFFFDGPNGALYCSAYLHDSDSDDRRFFLLLPPFGEELNKSRHILAALLRALGRAGHDVLMPDLFGTGDSAGDFADASLDDWRSDIDAVVSRYARGHGVDLVGLRFGGLLAAEASRRHKVASLTLLHPVTQGQQQLNQLLRLRLASGLMGQGTKETAAGLRDRLDAGETLEIAGYGINPALAQGMKDLAMDDLVIPAETPVNWLELVAEADRPLMPVSRRVIEQWQSVGVCVNTATAVCPSFWATQEIAQCPALVDLVVQMPWGPTDG